MNLISHHVDIPEVAITRFTNINTYPENIFHFIERIGGQNGWYTFDWLLKIRLLLSGKIKPYKRDYKLLTVGDKVDFFKVVEIEKDKYLILKFENNLLDGIFGFYLKIIDATNTELYASTYFKFKNLRGKIYWLFVKPFDSFLQQRMLANIKKLSENLNR